MGGKPRKISQECLDTFVQEDLTQSQIAKLCDMSRQGVHIRINYEKVGSILLRQIDTVIEMLETGHNARSIAEATGTSCNGVYTFIKRNLVVTKTVKVERR